MLPIPASAFVPDHSGAGQTILDSGTQFTFLLAPVYNVLKTEFTKQTKSVLTVDPGAELTVSGQKLLYHVPGRGADQKYCFTFGNSELAGVEMFIVGNLHQQNVWMEYDIAQAKVGFANDVKCNQASQLLGSIL
ncbi:hypothetical protein Bca52824_000082 [Brassica carinata]|uniref:Peptidase A1 domain-containing protein n=1 Tax=Brassica carinata TaxID=52824 RepID=A0A8X8BCG0_BRACI|nr:hypothetical protein Bca52824_000082 [Brassica carinata]